MRSEISNRRYDVHVVHVRILSSKVKHFIKIWMELCQAVILIYLKKKKNKQTWISKCNF